MLAALAQTSVRLLQCGQAALDRSRLRLSRVEARMPDLPGIVGAARQRLDDRAERLALAPLSLMHRKRAALDAIGHRLPHPRETLAGHRHAMGMLEARMGAALQRLLDRRQTQLHRLPDPGARIAAQLREQRLRLSGLGARLEGASYQGVLARGFALVRNAEGEAVTLAAGIAPGDHLSLVLQDGSLGVTVDGGDSSPQPKPRRTPKPAQGSLL
jgi:exodeoxyribonuclease VII large subunit